MTSIPANLARVPTALSSQLLLGSISNASREIVDMQVKLSSGRRILRPSDDAVGTSAVITIDDVLERREQRLRNLSHAEAVLNTTDSALGEMSNILNEAKGLASSQIGVGSDAETRDNQAKIVDAMLAEMAKLANSQFQDLYLFGGTATAREPVVGLGAGYQYKGEGPGLNTDIGLSLAVPITVSGEDAFGAVSTRVEGERDLDPIMTGATRLGDLDGARRVGINLGSVELDVGGTDLTVDLTGAHTVQDIIDTLQTAIQTVDGGAVVDIDPATENRLRITTALGVTITDPAIDATAADLGINQTFPPGTTSGLDLDPQLTSYTPLANLSGVTVPLGTIRISNGLQTRDVDLSAATTVEEVRNIVQGLGIGVRVKIAESGDRLDFVNDLSGASMSIGEVGGGTTATELGVRSLVGSTSLSAFNDGLGVQIVSGNVDPISGMPDPARDLDLRITTKDGTQVDVDFAGATTVQNVLDAINTAAAGAGLTVGVDFEAGLAADGNGIALTDNTAPPGVDTTVERLNGSFAAEDLGLLSSTTSATLVGEDRARVAVDSVFTHLLALRNALEADDQRGITLAGGKLEADIRRVAETRAAVGVRARRVVDATEREEDLRIQDMSLRSEIQDLDFAEAAMRFALLQTQLQAGLTSASQISNLSLLDFLR